MEACQTLPLPGSPVTLPRDLLTADLPPADGGAADDQRPVEELQFPPPEALRSPPASPVPACERDVLNAGSHERDVEVEHPSDLPASETPDCVEDDDVEEHLIDAPSRVTNNPSTPSTPLAPRSCIRRCIPARRRSDSSAPRPPAPDHRRGSEAPPPRPRSVHFPSVPVTAVIPPADPLRLLGCGDTSAAYRQACERHGCAPLPLVLDLLREPSEDVLQLSGVPLSLADVDSLEEVMRRRRFRRVDAADCGLREETLAALLQIVTHYDAAPWLSVAGSSSERLGWAAVCAAVRGAGRVTGLQWLSLAGTQPGEVAAAALGRSLRDSGLRVLHLERCRLHGRPLLTLLAAGLRAASGLRQLYLGGNGLGAGDGSLLGAALRQNTALQLIDLRNNALDDDAAGYLLNGLSEQKPTPTHPGLLTLNLWHNRLTADSANTLSHLLSVHPTLETLNLGANPLTDAAVELLATPLSRPGPLRRLGLQRCCLSVEGAAALGRALATGSGLVRLDLRGNQLGVAGLGALLDGVQGNRLMRQLDVDVEELVPPGVDDEMSEVVEGPSAEAGDRGSPEFADSGVDSPARIACSTVPLASTSGRLDPESDGAALGTSADSILDTSVDWSPAVLPPLSGAVSAGCPRGHDSGGEYTELVSALAAVCEENRRRAAAAAGRTPGTPPEEGEGADHWLQQRLSAALRRVSLTCETPPRVAPAAPAPAAAPATAVPSPATAAQPVPVPAKPRHRRLVSPTLSPSQSPLPSPTSGRSRFRVFRVSSVEPGTPPLTRGLPPPPLLGDCERTPSPGVSREGSPALGRWEGEGVHGKGRKDSIAVSRERSLRGCGGRPGGPGGFDAVGEAGDQWSQHPRLSPTQHLTNGELTPPAAPAAWTPPSSPPCAATLTPASAAGPDSSQCGAGESVEQLRRSAPRVSPRPAGRKFRVTPVREPA